MNVTCSAEPCPIILDCSCVCYSGANLIYTGIVTNDTLCIALQKIDQKFKDAAVGYIFQNGIIQAIPGGPVRLGGTLVENTVITSGPYTFALTGTIESTAFITTGGTASQFVKGDGSLDSTTYQPSGNYITALTGDGTASGPGSAVFTLASVNPTFGTWGSSTQIPVITTDVKGRITNITTTAVSVPSGILSFIGDVTGSGVTGSATTLTLATVNSNVYATNTPLIFSVNAKGLVTSAAPFTNLTIQGILGYIPIGDAPSDGTTYGRKNGTWVSIASGSGTVTSVGATVGTGISVSVSNPTTTPNITITNTAPDQTVVLNSGTGISVTGTYPNFTITATGGGGTVTAVTASSPLASSGGTAPNITIQQASGSQAGYLSSTDWTTFNSKQNTITLTTTGTSGAATFIANTLNIPQYQAVLTNPVTGTGTTNYVPKWSSSSALTDSQIFDNGTSVGVGTTSPFSAVKLQVNGIIATTSGGFNLDSQNIYVKTGFYIGSGTYIEIWAGNNKIGDYNLVGNTTNKAYYTQDIGFNNSSGTGMQSSMRIASNVTPNGANSIAHNQILIDPQYIHGTFGTGALRGVYYNPTVTSLNGADHIAWENTSGDIIHGNLSGSGTRMVVADSTGKLSTQTIGGGGTVTSIATAGLISGGTITTSGTISTSMNTNKLVGRTTAGTGVMEEISVGTGLSLSAGTLSASVNSSITHATASGTDTYTATITGVTSYADGDVYLIRFTNGNTTGCTLNINSIGAVTLYRNNDGALIGGDIVNGAEMLCVYNSTLSGFQCIGTAPNTLLGYVTNADSVTITKGQVVYAFGGTGDRMTVKLAYNTSDATSAKTVGVVMSASIGVNQKGLIMIQGLLDGLSILPTSTYSDGDSLYLGATAGSITNVKPYAPNHLVYVATVTTASNGSAGRMYVRIQNGYELDELHNVQAQSPSLNDTLYYDSSVSPGQWKTASIATILGYTPVNPTRSISTTSPLSGGGDLSANRTLSISQATTSTSGYLSSTDWNIFNNKVSNVSGTSPISSTGGVTPTISISQATTSTNGYLSSTDWNTFNGKANLSQAAYTMLANNTNGTANMTAQTFVDIQGTYTGTITWTGTAPTTQTINIYQWSQVGKWVRLQLFGYYTNAGTGVTALQLTLPSDVPTPDISMFTSGALSILYNGVGGLGLSNLSLTLTTNCYMRRNSANTGNELYIVAASANYRRYQIDITYRAQ